MARDVLSAQFFMSDPNAIFQKGPDKKRVVIVDDSESMRMVLTRFLVNKGWEVAAFSNGFEPGRFNMAFTDVDNAAKIKDAGLGLILKKPFELSEISKLL